MDWRGAAADTLRTETHSDMLTTSAVADQLHEAAKVARSGAADLYAARSRVRYAVQDARAAGVRCRRRPVGHRSKQWWVGRAACRPANPGTSLRRRHPPTSRPAVGVDQQVVAKVTAVVAGIRHAVPPTPVPPHRHRASACRPSTTAPGNRTRRRRRRRNLPPVPSADDIRKVLHKLPVGNSPDVREIGSPEDLQNLWRCAQQNGVEIPNG